MTIERGHKHGTGVVAEQARANESNGGSEMGFALPGGAVPTVQRKPLMGGERSASERAYDAPARVSATAQRGVAGSGSPLPYLSRLQAAFGRHDLTTVSAHVGGTAKHSAREIGANAYAVGEAVAFAGEPDLRTAAHEAAHVIQQRHGQVPAGGVGRDGDDHEQHAEAVAAAVVSGQSAEPLLDQLVGEGAATPATAVQRDRDKQPDQSPEQSLPGLKMMVMVFDGSGVFLGGTASLSMDAPSQDSYQADRVDRTWHWQDDAPGMKVGVKIDAKGRRSGGQSVEHWVATQSFGKRAATIRVEFDYPVAYRSDGNGDFDLPSWDDELKPRGGEAGAGASQATETSSPRAVSATDTSVADASAGQTATTDTGDSASGDPMHEGADRRGAHGAEGGTVGNGRKSGPRGGAAGNTSSTGRRMGERGGEGDTTSIVHNDGAERAPGQDANIPMAGGKRGGAAGGEVGSTTHGVAGALAWWGVIDLGTSASAAAAIAAIISDADISGAGQSLFKAARRIGKNAGKLAKEATAVVDQIVTREVDRLAQTPEFLAKTAAEQKALLDAARADLTQATRVRVAQHLDEQIAEYEHMAATYTGDYADDFRSMAKENAEQFRDARAALGDVDTAVSDTATKGPNLDASRVESPALSTSPYHPDAVENRIKPPYEPNPAHDPRSPKYNPKKTPEPRDAAEVYASAVRARHGTWWGYGEQGWYQFFGDNAKTAHFAGIKPEADVPVAIRKAFGR